ncbi:glycosyltransferase family 2 protein [Planctomycetota bacterium]
MFKLIAQMIGRNEEARYVRDVLTHLSPLVDSIVYTDDASNDKTPDIFREFGAHVYTNESARFNVHEGQLRQAAWDNLGRHAQIGDWILAIDCDEKLFTTCPDKSLGGILETKKYHAIAITFYHMWNDRQYRTDKAWAPSPQARIFRYIDGCPFTDRALACGSGPEYVQYCEMTGNMLPDTGLVMQHFGYLREPDRQAKYDRYMEIDGGRYHELSHLQSIVDPQPVLSDWESVGVSTLRLGCQESPRPSYPCPPRARR